MVFNSTRLITGIGIVFIVGISYLYNLDKILISLIISMVIYDLIYSKIIHKVLNNIFFYFSYLIFAGFIFLEFYLLLFILLLLFSFSSLINSKYLNLFFVLIISIYLFFFNYLLLNDREYFYLIILISFLNDSSAYIFGNLFRGPVIIPKISPKKTWSGTLSSSLISIIFLVYLQIPLYFAFIISISFFIGDIYFSFIKRKNNIKDFSNILNLHGGILDRLDSILLPASLYFVYSNYLV